MKIAILTQPLQSNYGGLLQAWALQKTLAEMGHSVTIINRVNGKSNIPLWRKVAGKIKNELLISLGKRKRYIPVTEQLKEYSEQNVIKFRQNRYLGISPILKSNKKLLDYIERQNFDAYIVGSDQVWRPKYSPNLMTYFLDFVRDNQSVKKISYAASFGVDNWEFTEKETREARKLIILFDLITVRELSGIKLVKDHFNCNATHVLDPTMLLQKEEYINLVKNTTVPLKESEGELFSYVLDKSQTLSETIHMCSSITGMKPFYCNYSTNLYKLESSETKDNCVVPPVEQWIKSFMEAKMVITDSFHGTVFSILFNKPFWIVANKTRGVARFMSLLNLFELEDRIVIDPNKIDWNKEIDWQKINFKRSKIWMLYT